MTFAITYSTKVVDIFHKTKRIHVSGTGPDAIFNEESLGWFVLYEGSYEALHAGAEKPHLAIGDTVTITIRKQ